MRFLQFCRTNSSNKDADDLQPKVQKGAGTVVEPCDGKSNASSARIKESEACQIAAKSLRLKLDVSASNSWDLRVVWQSIYIKYMHIYKGISDKAINEKKKTTQSSLISKISRKSVLGSFSCLWLMVKNEQLPSTEYGDEEIHV